MSIPVVNVNLIYPPSSTVVDLGPYLTQDISLDITSSFEAPGQTGTITAGEVSIKGTDVTMLNGLSYKSGAFRSILSQIQPGSTNFQIQIWRDGAKRFDGYILPNTVQFNAQEFSFAFTAVSIAARLGTVEADDLRVPALATLQRSAVGWTVLSTTLGALPWLTVTGPGSCPFLTGDTIALDNAGKREETRVNDVTYDGAAWRISVDTLDNAYGSGTPIELVTPFLRSVAIRTAVDALLVGAGLNPTTNTTFNATFFTAAGGVFASPLAMAELVGGVRTPLDAPLGLALYGPRWTADGMKLLIYTKNYKYRQDSPPAGDWTRLGTNPASRPIDWTRYGDSGLAGSGNSKTYVLSGLRSRTRPITEDTYGHDWLTPATWQGDVVEYMFYCYDYTSDSFVSPTRRYYLRICVDDAGQFHPVKHWSLDFGYETTTDGYTWSGGMSGPSHIVSYNAMSATNLHEWVPKVCGLDIDVKDQVVYFSEPQGDAAEPVHEVNLTRVSSYSIGSGVVHPAVITDRGVPHCYRHERLGIFDIGAASIYFPDASGTLPTYFQTVTLPLDFMPFSIVTNWGADFGGDRLYALSSSPNAGTTLLSFNAQLSPSGTPFLLLGKGAGNGNAEMIAISIGNPGTWPMVAIIGSQAWWIGSTYSGMIDYLDIGGVSCGQAISDLATLVNGWCYIDGTGASWFRTRNLPSGLLIGADVASSRIDDARCMSLPEAPVLFGTYLFIRVESTRDPNTFGEAGDAGFRDGPLALTLSNPFIPSSSFAAALAGMIYGYLGRPLAGFNALHQDDGRTYEPGAECWAQIGGALRHFQLVSVTRQILADAVQAQGMEL